MIFEASPDDIERLDAKGLVELLRLLLHAEAQHAGIPLASVSVPLQITVSDGGEDARIWWTGGVERTDYLPSRSCFLQSKATDPGPAGWKKEVWTKASAKKSKGKKKASAPKLNAAITGALSQKGSYIGFTATPLVGDRLQNRIKAIREGIAEAGGNPLDLAAIELYDANKIAAWTSRHPAVAVWLREQQSGLTLGGFRTLEGWGKHTDIAAIPLTEDKAPRFCPADKPVEARERADPARNTLTFAQVKERIFQHLADPGHCVAVTGPSGVGKTRFAYEILRDASTTARAIRRMSAVVCDCRIVDREALIQVAQWMAQQGTPTLLVVDECSRDMGSSLGDLAREHGSDLRVLTIGLDERDLQSDQWLSIHVEPSDADLIKGIIKHRLPDADDVTVSYIQALSGGYPRIADLATHSYKQKTPVLKSLDDVVSRVLEGARITNSEQVRAVETAALFNKLGAEDEFAATFDRVAERLAGLSGDRMFEHLVTASQSQIVDRKGRFFFVQPLPMVAFLGARRLDLLRVDTLMTFIQAAPTSLKQTFFKQWRYFDRTRAAPTMAQRLMNRDGPYGTYDAINTDEGSEVVHALVHVAPDFVADRLDYLLRDKSIDELQTFSAGRRNIIWALEKLAFRKRTFVTAARLLLRLAAAENESWGNNASGQFKQLYQLQLAGTEAPPADRFIVLDDGLASSDARVVDICVSALETVLEHHFSRHGGAEQIGSGPPLRDWTPKTWGEVHDYHRNGFRRLDQLRKRGGTIADSCERAIATHLRGLISDDLFPDVEAITTQVSAEKGMWPDAIKSIGDWLYFDRDGAPVDLAKKVRDLYDALMPKDLIQQSLLYTTFWSAEIRDPDLLYSKASNSAQDYEFSTRKAVALAEQAAASPTSVETLIQLMVGKELHNAFPFAQALGRNMADPVTTFSSAVKVYEVNPNGPIQFLRGLLHGVDERDKMVGNQCLQIALKSEGLKLHAPNFYTAILITPDRLADVTARLRDKSLGPDDCRQLSYGRGLDHLSVTEIRTFLDELATNHGPNGIWSGLEIVSMYQFGRSSLDADLETIIKGLLTAPRLLDEVGRGSRDGHLFESLVELIDKKGTLDADFVSAISAQIVRVCQSTDHELFFTLDDPLRKAISTVVRKRPSEVWAALSVFAETATSLERYRLETLVAPSKNGDDGDGAGILFAVPEAELLAWADHDPGPRSAFLTSFFPMLVRNGGGHLAWHDAMRRLADRFGKEAMFRDALASRLRPSSWWGSVVPYLAKYLPPLEEWSSHTIPQLAAWAGSVHSRLEREIATEQVRDEEEN